MSPSEPVRLTFDNAAQRLDDGPDKRREILDVAASHFLEGGLEGASINAMARESGISKESFYRYFESKEHLLMAVIDRELEQYKHKITRLSEDWDSTRIRESLLNLAETLLGLLMTDRQQAVRRLIFSQTKRAPEFGRHYWEIGPQLAYGILESFFATLAGRTEFPARTLSRSFVALVLHDLMLQRSCGVCGNPSPEEISELSGPIVDDFLAAYFRAPAEH